MKSFIRIISLFFVCAATQAATPTRQEVLRAIEELHSDVLSDAAARALQTITRFAEESGEVSIVISPLTVPWMDEGSPTDGLEIARSVLLVAYYAGEIRVQLKLGTPKDDPQAGWLMVFDVYRQLQNKRPITLESVDRLIALKAEGELEKHAEQVLQEAKKPNQQSSEATAASVTPRAEPRIVPAGAAAHL